MRFPDLTLIGLMLAYAGGVALAGAWFGFETRFGFYAAEMWYSLAVLAVAGAGALSVRRMAARPERLLAAVGRDCVAAGWPRLKRGLPFLLVLPLFLSAFTSQKAAIAGFGWDLAFIRLDAALHGGDAWRLIAPLVSSPAAVLAVNFAYNLWLPLMWLVTIWQALSLGPHRAQYLLSYILAWILGGTLLAHAFASAGPCFVEALHGDGRFATLMTRLAAVNETVPVWALTAQDYLLARHQDRALGIGGGISAMPSLHVAIATLMALLGWRLSRAAGIALTAFALLIMLGSVQLGWHYAIDGYAGAALAGLIWRAVGCSPLDRRKAARLAPS